MATAGGGGGEKSEKEKKWEKLKSEIRSYLVCAKNGSTFDSLQEDYVDMNGRPIPFEEFGLNNMDDLIRAMPDVIRVQRLRGVVTLFAISDEKTERLESLIARQRPSKQSRLGGTNQQQQSAASRQRAIERRQIVEKRLIEITSRANGFIPYNMLQRQYQATYYEKFDPKVEFNCPPKVVFGQKLGRLFIVAGRGSSGSFLIRLRDTARPTNNGMQQQQNGNFTQASARSSSSIVYDQVSQLGNESAPRFGQNNQSYNRQQSTAYGNSYRPPTNGFGSSSRGSSSRGSSIRGSSSRGSSSRGGYRGAGTGSGYVAPRFATGAGATNKAPTTQPAQRVAASDINNVNKAMSNGTSLSVTIFNPTPTPTTAPKTVVNNIPQQPVQQRVVHQQRPVSPPPVRQQQRPVSPPPVRQTASIPNGRPNLNPKEQIVQLLAKYPKGIELAVFEDAYYSMFQQKYTIGYAFLLTDCCNICDVVDVGNGHYRIKPKIGAAASAATAHVQLPPPTLDELKVQCKQILRAHPQGITYLGFPKAYRAIIGRELDLAPYKFLSLSELVESMGDVFSSQKKNGEILLYETKLNHVVGPVVKSYAAPAIAAQATTKSQDLILDELWFVVMSAPNNSLLVNQLRDAYKVIFGTDLPVPVKEFDAFTLDLFNHTDRFDFLHEGILKVLAQPEYKPVSSLLENLTIDDKIGENISAPPPVRSSDHVTGDERYIFQTLPLTVAQLNALAEGDPNRQFEVLIGQIETPAHFFIQLKATYEELEKLITEMNEYYALTSNVVPIFQSDLKVGAPCVCLYEDQLWYRGLIKSIGVDGTVEVSLVDYGTEITVKSEAVNYLVRQFFFLPAQGILCKLAYLSPPGETWPVESGDVMAQMCGTAVLCAEVYKILNGVPHIFLKKRMENGTEGYINDVLYEANLAVFSETEIDQQTESATASPDVDDADLEDEIQSVTENSEHSFQTAYDDDLNSTEKNAMESLVRAAIPETDLSFEKDVMDRLKNGPMDNIADLEVVVMAKTVMLRKRMALTKRLTGGNSDFDLIVVDKLAWLEEQIHWLNDSEKLLQTR